MRKIFMLLIMGVFFISLGSVSALDFDNVKSYDQNTETITVTNAFGLGETLVRMRLTTPITNNVPDEGNGVYQKVAEIRVFEFKQSYSDAIRGTRSYDLNDKFRELNRDIKLRYRQTIREWDEPIYEETNCINNQYSFVNGTPYNIKSCDYNIIGYEQKKEYGWVDFNNLSELPSSNVTIGIFTDVKIGDKVEWIPDTWFGEKIDEWAVWTSDLNVDVRSYYKLDESSGVVLDSVTGRFNGTADVNVTRGVAGIIEKGYYFNGSLFNPGGNVTLEQNFNFTNRTQAFTINLWVNISQNSSVDDNRAVIGMDSPPTAFSFGFDNNPFRFFVARTNAGNAQTAPTGTSNLTQNRWYMITSVWNGNDNLTLYVNGSIEASARTTCFPNGSIGCEFDLGNGPFVAGFDDTYNIFPNVTLDEIGVWNRSLTNAEIQQLYNNGAGITFNANPSTGVTLNSPSNNTITANNTILFNATVEAGNGNLTNGTLFIYYENGSIFNQTTNILSGIINNTTWNISNLVSGIYQWNVEACQNQGTTACTFATRNRTITIGLSIINEAFPSITTEGNLETFQINITLQSGVQVTSAVLLYNITEFSSTSIENTGGSDYTITKILSIPNVDTSITIPFRWNITKTDSVSILSDSHNLIVNPLFIDDCTNQSILILNYTLRDEDTESFLTSNTTIEIDLDISPFGTTNSILNFSKSYNNTNPARVCINNESLQNNTRYRMDVIAKYFTNTRSVEYHNIQNFTLSNSTIPQNINLLDLLITRAQEFQITLRDANFLPLEDALIDITRFYIPQGVFKSVEVPKTDSDGKTIGHFVVSDEIYTLVISKDGRHLITFHNVRAICDNIATGDCQINLNLFTTGLETIDFAGTDNLDYDISFNRTTRIVRASFSTLDGSTTTMILNVTKFDNFGNTTVCDDTLTTSTGILSCTVPSSFGNTTILATLYSTNSPINFITQSTFSIIDSSADIFGATRIIMIMILLVTLPLLALTSGIAFVVITMMSLLILGLLNIYTSESFVGPTSTILWFMIAGGILLWKISKREA